MNSEGPGNDEEILESELAEPSGSGALGGLFAGGLLGAPFGPPGVILGGIVGGLLGNAVEYQNLKDEKQEKLRSAAEEFIRSQNTNSYIELEEFHGVTEDSDPGGDYWLFEFSDQHRNIHGAKLYIDEPRFEYVR